MTAKAEATEKSSAVSQKYGVYAGFGASGDWKEEINTYENMSGPNYVKDCNLASNSTRWFAFDLCEKYNRDSPLKQFHMLTIYLRDSTNKKTGGYLIKANLPEQFTYSIGGVWGNPINLSAGETLNTLLQQLSGGRASLRHTVDSFMVWQAPKRMEFVFKIKVFDDSGNNTRINYQEALELLSSCVLPKVDTNGYYESIPGPVLTRVLNNRPLGEKTIRGAQTANKIAQNGDSLADAMNGRKSPFDRVTVQIGGLLLVDWCVIRDVKITYPNTKNQVLHSYMGINKGEGINYKMHLQPLMAELEITISTVQSLTFPNYRTMLYLTEQTQPDDLLGKDQDQKTREIYGYTSVATGREVGDNDWAGFIADHYDQAIINNNPNMSHDPAMVQSITNQTFGINQFTPIGQPQYMEQ